MTRKPDEAGGIINRLPQARLLTCLSAKCAENKHLSNRTTIYGIIFKVFLEKQFYMEEELVCEMTGLVWDIIGKVVMGTNWILCNFFFVGAEVSVLYACDQVVYH